MDGAVVTSEQPPTASENHSIWTGSSVTLPREKQTRTAIIPTITFKCASLEELESSLRNHLAGPPKSPENATCEFTIWWGASFVVVLPNDAQESGLPGQPLASPDDMTSLCIMQALTPMLEEKQTIKRQRAIAKTIIDAIRRVDGYRYSFHNSWKSEEDGGYRFSYYCNDSLLNKDRVANGKIETAGKRPIKPTYDCRGIITVKFSVLNDCVNVVYRHVPIHGTYEERAPASRKDSRRHQLLENAEGERRPKKRKKKKPRTSEHGPVPASTAESDLRMQSLQSLLELIRPEPVKDAAPDPVETGTASGTTQQSGNNADGNLSKSHGRPRKICESCRRRRVRCDTVRPKCKLCTEKGRVCSYDDDPTSTAHGVLASAEVEDLSEFSYRTVEDVDYELASTKAELDKLKAKLSDIEKRIKRLEAGKAKLDTERLTGIAREVQQQTRLPQTPQQAGSQQQYPTPGPSANVNTGFQHQAPTTMPYNSTPYQYQPYAAPHGTQARNDMPRWGPVYGQAQAIRGFENRPPPTYSQPVMHSSSLWESYRMATAS